LYDQLKEKQGRSLEAISPTFYEQFLSEDPKSAKKTSHQCLFALLGSAHVEASLEMLVKSTPLVGVGCPMDL